ncbi:MAG: hypothetical protein QOK00_3444 [Thermoleophilaceae bacterium]|jgi:hypothetical protein|nr:hypothetical protein [Thermoleophilaceae bacterium]
MPLSTSIRPPRRRAIAVALAGALCLSASFGSSVASASEKTSIVTTTASGITILETPETRQSCTAPETVSAFASLGDMRDYVLAPGGSFEDRDLDGWQVHRAKSESGGSPLEVGDDNDNRRSLKVPAGGSAISPAMCVDLHYPTLRLMTKAQRYRGQLQVDVIYPDSADPVFHPVATLTGGSSDRWQASADMPVFPERGGAEPGMRRVALRFTSVAADGNAGEWRLDDLYVDPKRL